MFRRFVVLCFAVASLPACLGVNYVLTPSTGKTLKPKPADCEFQILNLPPHGSYEELGSLTSSDGMHADNPADFKKAVATSVCKAGGDAVVTEVNGGGYYVRGTVVRRVE